MFFSTGSFYLRDVFWLHRKASSTPAIGRSHSAISVRLDGSARFYTHAQTVCVRPGDVIFIPAGLDYHIENSDEELIILHLDAHGVDFTKMDIITPTDPGAVTELLRELSRLWQQRLPGYRNLCTAKLYELFALLETQAQPAKGKSALLEPGLVYLNAHLEDPELTVGQLAAACRISQVYFRRLFRELYGTSPALAIRQRRLQQAARLLQTGYYSVSETARLCGFPDVKYFSTAFKAAMGTSPSAYMGGKLSQIDKL